MKWWLITEDHTVIFIQSIVCWSCTLYPGFVDMTETGFAYMTDTGFVDMTDTRFVDMTDIGFVDMTDTVVFLT